MRKKSPQKMEPRPAKIMYYQLNTKQFHRFLPYFTYLLLFVPTPVCNTVASAKSLSLHKRKRIRYGQQHKAPKFPCHVKDVKFLGKPIDFIGFKTTGDSELIEEVLFIEVKTGDSTLSKREESLKKAIEKGKVRYVEYRYKGEVSR